MTDHNTAGADYSIRVSQRLDGFRSFDAGATTGTLLTRPLLVRGDHLELKT